MKLGEQALIEFNRHGQNASFHYDDDSNKEWHIGDEEKRIALEVFDAFPALQAEFRKIARNFSWSLELERPSHVATT